MESTLTFALPRRRATGVVRSLGPWRIVLAIVLFAIGAGLGYLRTFPPAATVMSASMTPTIDTGDVVLLKRLDRAPRVGDVVAVDVPEQARVRYGYPPEVIHRVVRIDGRGTVTTKGDARKTPDPFSVPAAAVKERVVGHIPAAGRVLAFLTSPFGLIWIAAGAVMFMVLPALERRRAMEHSEQQALEQLREELRSVSSELARLRLERHSTVTTQEPGVVTRPRRRSGGLVGALRRALR